MLIYEELLSSNIHLAIQEGSMHFEKEGGLHKTLDRIVRDLDEWQIPYCIVGGMAMFFHGYRRFTEDVDLLVTQQGLEEIHRRLSGHGYLPPFEGSRNLRDTETGVRIEFLVTGAYPGDGKPKPVSFPSPQDATIVLDGKNFLTLPKLVELKLASGMSNPRRARDLADVQDLIAALNLHDDLATELNESVRSKYLELCQVVRDFPE